MSRYHPVLVTLHWLLALLIVVLLFAGKFLLEPLANSDPDKIAVLRIHMVVGLVVLVLMLARLAIRASMPKPEHAHTGNALLDRAGVWTHWAFYAVVILMAASGIGVAALAGLPGIVFGGSGDPLPADFADYTPRIVHGILANLLIALIVLHVAAAVWHQFGLKDRLLQRMWFGNRAA